MATATEGLRRYALGERIGAGGMGSVYRALDRLTGRTVALKRVVGRAGSGTGDVARLRLALAREFRTLASLRHPHVVGVLDYGFDAGEPYFTMEYLEGARPVTEARELDPPARLRLLDQLLEAFVYIHRRGILHRDLKPGNVLEQDGRVWVLDFGIAALERRDAGEAVATSGTLAYMAPELLSGGQPTVASDLYAVGVIAFELLAGRPLFEHASPGVLITRILDSVIPLDELPVDPAVRDVVGRLLDREPARRFRRASDAKRALAEALGEPLPPESREVRESFLQAAEFVGRERELSELTGALEAAVAGRGSSWLVGGESGVGKSRLMEELRIRALVSGALVLRGSGASDGAPYHVWREVLRTLAAYTELLEDEARVLKPLVPDIGELIGAEVADPPPLDPNQARIELFRTVESVLRRQPRPVLLILEDLHWAGSESLALLAHVAALTSELPLLVVGDYRNDERPDLPQALSSARTLLLERLSDAAIADLAASMLGDAGRDRRVVELLRRETEGNAFFVVEVVRALAEQAGSLEGIGAGALPAHVAAGGVDEIVQRRLARVPESARQLLRLAAVVGRRIDPFLLARMRPGADVEEWLTACANAAVLDQADEQWRFAHDKLREGVLAGLGAEHAPLHREAALAIEAGQPDADDAGTLARLWRAAGEPERERPYTLRAGERALAVGASAEAEAWFRRLLDLIDDMPGGDERNRAELVGRNMLAYALMNQRGYGDAEVERSYVRARELSEHAEASMELPPILYGLFSYYGSRAEYEAALRVARQILEVGEELGDRNALLIGNNAMAIASVLSGDVVTGEAHARETVRAADARPDPMLTVRYGGDFRGYARTWLAIAQCVLGRPDAARRTFGEAMAVTRAHPYTRAFVLAFAEVPQLLRDAAEAARRADELQELAGRHGFALLAMIGSLHRGWATAAGGGDAAAAAASMAETIGILRYLKLDSFAPFYLALLAEAQLAAGQVDAAGATLEDALACAQAAGGNFCEPELLRLRGDVRLRADDARGGEAAFEAAIERAAAARAGGWELRATVSLARALAGRGKRRPARKRLERICKRFEGVESPDLVEARGLLATLR